MNRGDVRTDVPTHTHAAAFSDGAAYEQTLGGAHRHFMRVKARALRSMIRRHAPSAKRLLDLGCGTGQMEEALEGRGFEMVGVDLSPAMIAHAERKRLPGVKFIAADAGATGLPPGGFDVVFATALLHHVPPKDRQAVFREMVRLVKPGGLVVVFEHNPRNPLTRRMVRTTPVDADAILLERAEMRGLFAGAALNVLEERFLVFFPRPLALLSLVEPALGWCPAGGQYVLVGKKSPARARGRGPA